MKVESRFDIGQKVWSIQGNKAIEIEVTKIDFGSYSFYKNDEFSPVTFGVTYGLGQEMDFQDGYTERYSDVPEDKVFATKQELIDSL